MDETKFVAALQNDPDSVKRLFTANDTSKGVIVRAQAYISRVRVTSWLV
jgi:flagellar capping protein FliD